MAWEPKGILHKPKGIIPAVKKRRSLEISDVLELQVGQESAVFMRHADALRGEEKWREQQHLSLTLLLIPEDDDVEASKSRASLDIR